MKSNGSLKFLLLLIIPALFMLSGTMLKHAQGPYYLNFYDPTYVYLINSLNLAQMSGYGVGHFDHPGTTVQTAGAIIIKIFHSLRNSGDDIVADVLKNPEEYLILMNRIFGFINTLFLLLLGLFTLKVSGNIWYSLMIQLSPFSSIENFFGYIIVAPDNFLIFTSICMLGLLIYYLYNEEENSLSKQAIIVSFALVFAFGMATKISFFPLAVFPLLLIKGTRGKITFIVISMIAFLFFVLPAIGNYGEFANWVKDLFIRSGNYGEGDATIINPREFLEHLVMIFEKDTFFLITYAVTIATTFLSLTKRNFIKTDPSMQRQFKLLIAVSITMTIQILIVAKQYRQHYMIPAFMLSIFSLSLCASLLASFFNSMKIIYGRIVIFVLIVGWGTYQVLFNYDLGSFQKNEAAKIDKMLREDFEGRFVVSTFATAGKQPALAFGISYAGSQTDRYRAMLCELQQNHIFYNPWKKIFYSISNESIKDVLLKEKKIIHQNWGYGIHDFIKSVDDSCSVSNTSFTKIYTNGNGESLYEVTVGD
ncbi:MAG: hypothetical protein WBC65_15595 [Ignavibacteria bacterium]